MAWSDIPTCKSQGLDIEYLMLRGIFMTPGATPDQVAFYVDLLKKVRETPEWKDLMKDGAFNQTFMTGADYAKWVEKEEARHRDLMKEAGFLAKHQLNSRSRSASPAGARPAGMLPLDIRSDVHDRQFACGRRRPVASGRRDRRRDRDAAVRRDRHLRQPGRSASAGAPKARAPGSFRSMSGCRSSSPALVNLAHALAADREQAVRRLGTAAGRCCRS